MLNIFPWKLLVASMANQVAVSEYGKNLMRETMKTYSHNKHWYTKLGAHGYKILAEAMKWTCHTKLPALRLLFVANKIRRALVFDIAKRGTRILAYLLNGLTMLATIPTQTNLK